MVMWRGGGAGGKSRADGLRGSRGRVSRGALVGDEVDEAGVLPLPPALVLLVLAMVRIDWTVKVTYREEKYSFARAKPRCGLTWMVLMDRECRLQIADCPLQGCVMVPCSSSISQDRRSFSNFPRILVTWHAFHGAVACNNLNDIAVEVK
jgi:hypothetical protein